MGAISVGGRSWLCGLQGAGATAAQRDPNENTTKARKPEEDLATAYQRVEMGEPRDAFQFQRPHEVGCWVMGRNQTHKWEPSFGSGLAFSHKALGSACSWFTKENQGVKNGAYRHMHEGKANGNHWRPTHWLRNVSAPPPLNHSLCVSL